MLIANPIYDTVFKHLMENDKVAKFFIGTLLEQKIESVQVRPKEFTYTPQDLPGLTVFRLDFIAVVKTETGENKKILIEIQKARNFVDLMRFRNYLAEQYKKEETIDGKNTPLPIVTIYILGFNLGDIDAPCIKVARNYVDMTTGQILNVKHNFIENLTHDCFIVQVLRIKDNYQTRLDKLLSLFEQRHFTSDDTIVKEYKHKPDLDELKTMTKILNFVGTDPQKRLEIETEQEAWRTLNAMFGGYAEKFVEMSKTLEENKKTLEENQKALQDKDKALQDKDKALQDKDKALQEQQRLIEELLKKTKDKQ